MVADTKDVFDEFEISEEEIEATLGDTEPLLQLPSLFEKLQRMNSNHQHKYGNVETIYDDLDQLKKSGEQPTAEQEQLLADVELIETFTSSGLYKFVYTSKEIHELATLLRLMSMKNRPDFDGIEADILDVLSGQRGAFFDKSLSGTRQRAERNAPTRQGMQWATLIDKATTASDRLLESLNQSEDRKEYIIPIIDPASDQKRDLTAVYQFVANHFAYSVLMNRSVVTKKLNEAAFEENCQIIKDYYESIQPLLAELPADLRMGIPVGTRGQIRTMRPQQHLDNLIEFMNARLAKRDKGRGMSLGYKANAVRALRLQYRIAHFIEDINAYLRGDSDGNVTVLDIDDTAKQYSS